MLAFPDDLPMIVFWLLSVTLNVETVPELLKATEEPEF